MATTLQILNPKTLTSDQLVAVKAAIENEQAQRARNVEKLTKEFRAFVSNSEARMQETLAAFRAAPPANGNGEHKAEPAKKAATPAKKAAKRKARQAYKIPGSDRVWKGYGPAPKELKALPREQWAQHAV